MGIIALDTEDLYALLYNYIITKEWIIIEGNNGMTDIENNTYKNDNENFKLITLATTHGNCFLGLGKKTENMKKLLSEEMLTKEEIENIIALRIHGVYHHPEKNALITEVLGWSEKEKTFEYVCTTYLDGIRKYYEF